MKLYQLSLDIHAIMEYRDLIKRLKEIIVNLTYKHICYRFDYLRMKVLVKSDSKELLEHLGSLFYNNYIIEEI